MKVAVELTVPPRVDLLVSAVAMSHDCPRKTSDRLHDPCTISAQTLSGLAQSSHGSPPAVSDCEIAYGEFVEQRLSPAQRYFLQQGFTCAVQR